MKIIDVKCDNAAHYRRVDGDFFPYTNGMFYVKLDDMMELVSKGYRFNELFDFNGSSIFNDWQERYVGGLK